MCIIPASKPAPAPHSESQSRTGFGQVTIQEIRVVGGEGGEWIENGGSSSKGKFMCS